MRLGLALLLAAVLLAIASAVGAGDPRLRVRGEDVPVNPGAGALSDIRAYNSPSLARNPRAPDQLAVTARIDGPDFSCALHVSGDAGRTWRATRIPIPSGPARKCYAPDAAFAPDGRLHVSYVTLRGVGNVPSAVWATSSADGGRTLTAPRRVSGELAFQVRIATDPGDARRLHLTWRQAGEVGPLRFTQPGNPIVASSSEDGGRTWSRPRRASAAARARVLAPTPVVGRGGALHVLFVDVGDDRLDYHGGHDGFGGPPYAGRHALVLARRRPGGAWQEAVVDDAVAPIERFVPFIPAFPALAIDRARGRIHAAYHDRRSGSADVRIWTLDPGAARWRATTVGDGAVQRLPQLAVAPGGRLDVAYEDRRAGPRSTTLLRSSFDAGRSFGAAVRLSGRSYDPRVGFGSERGMPDLGSRMAVAAGDDGAFAVWTDTRSGTDASGKQDLFLARTALVRPWRDPLRQAAVALACGGLAALLLAARRRRRTTVW